MEGHILPQVPEALVRYDREYSPMKAFLEALRMAEGEPHVHMEDDIILTRNFQSKVEAAIAQHPDQVINFFMLAGMEKDAPFMRGAHTYTGNQCFYVPPSLTQAMLGNAAKIIKELGGDYQTMYDTYRMDGFVRWNLKVLGQKYWQWHPSLAQHRVGESAISKRDLARVAENFEW